MQPMLLATRFGTSRKLRDRDSERGAQPAEHGPRRIPAPALDAREVRRVDACRVREILLAETALLAQRTDGPAQIGIGGVFWQAPHARA